MSQTAATEVTHSHGLPLDTSSPIKPNQRFYILYYRYGNVPHLNKVFQCVGTLRDAIERGREHCKKMNYIFILVRPFVVDLDEQEKAKLEDPNYIEHITR